MYLFYQREDEFSASNSSVVCPVAKVRIGNQTLENGGIWNPRMWSQESSPMNSVSNISFLNCFTWGKKGCNQYIGFHLSIQSVSTD